jgi:PEP-CTERM/exosortase A-associated glycosyltransferase
VRILHVLHTSLPNLSGYSIRANYIMQCQEALGMHSQVVTSAQHLGEDRPIEIIDDRQYWRTPKQPHRKTGLRELMLMHVLKNTIEKAVLDYKPDVIHAASPVLVGLPALRVARKHKLPLVYEVRDLWENASVDRGKWGYDSLPYRGARALETILFKKADGIVTICEALRNEIAPRIGKDVDLSVVPNGVESQLFQPSAPSQRVIEKWNFQGKKIIGYIGAFQPYEGLESLIRAMPEIAKGIPDAHLMITGGGNDLEATLHALVRSLDLGSLVTFTGRVPHSEVQEMYSVVDLMVYPRISTRTTELTTPLKPLEAMALEVPVMLSNTRAMCELVEDGVTGLTFHAGDPNALATACVRALSNPDKSLEMARRARTYVQNERHWPKIVESYQDIYESAIRRSRSRH